jgi:hypothetical protein
VASFDTRLWWAMVQRDLSERWGAIANARSAVERDRLMATQRAEAERALQQLREGTGTPRRTRVS